MSGGGSCSHTPSRAIPATRRVVLADGVQLPPGDYSTTPGGTLFSTTPGGRRGLWEGDGPLRPGSGCGRWGVRIRQERGVLGSRQPDGATEFRGARTGKNGTGRQGGNKSPGSGRGERARGSLAIPSPRARTRDASANARSFLPSGRGTCDRRTNKRTLPRPPRAEVCCPLWVLGAVLRLNRVGSGWATHHGRGFVGCDAGINGPRRTLLPSRGPPPHQTPSPGFGRRVLACACGAPRRHGEQMVLSGARRFCAQGPGAASRAKQKNTFFCPGGRGGREPCDLRERGRGRGS